MTFWALFYVVKQEMCSAGLLPLFADGHETVDIVQFINNALFLVKEHQKNERQQKDNAETYVSQCFCHLSETQFKRFRLVLSSMFASTTALLPWNDSLISRKLLELATSKFATTCPRWSLHFNWKRHQELLPVGIKSHKRVHFESCLDHDFSTFQAISKKFTVLERVIQVHHFLPVLALLRRRCRNDCCTTKGCFINSIQTGLCLIWKWRPISAAPQSVLQEQPRLDASYQWCTS